VENCGDVSTNIPDEIQKPAVRRSTVVALEAIMNPIWVMPVNMPIGNYGEFEEGEAAGGEGTDGEEEAAEIIKVAEYLFKEMCLDGFVPEGGVFPDREVTHRGGPLCCLIVPGNHTGHIKEEEHPLWGVQMISNLQEHWGKFVGPFDVIMGPVLISCLGL
jgi:hypothetical protein